MQIYNNYNIEEVLRLADKGYVNSDIAELSEEIKKYETEKNKKISVLKTQMPTERSEAMKWIAQNVEPDMQYYLRCEFLGEKYSVLRKKNGKYKKISDIGISVPERTSDSEKKCEEWLEKIKAKAVEIKATGLSFCESHAHYDLKDFDKTRNELMQIMHQAGVDKCVIPAVRYENIKKCIKMFDKPEYNWIYYTVGSHPKYIWEEKAGWTSDRWKEMRFLAAAENCRAIGEVGLDYSFRDFDEQKKQFQEEMFVRFIEVSNKLKKPVVLHIRPAEGERASLYDVHKDALKILRDNPIENGAVVHCYGGGTKLMTLYMEVIDKVYFGIGGRITNSIEELEACVKEMPLDRILLETDAPFVTPVGKNRPNTSLALYEIACYVAKLKGEDIRVIAEKTSENFMDFFKIEN